MDKNTKQITILFNYFLKQVWPTFSPELQAEVLSCGLMLEEAAFKTREASLWSDRWADATDLDRIEVIYKLRQKNRAIRWENATAQWHEKGRAKIEARKARR